MATTLSLGSIADHQRYLNGRGLSANTMRAYAADLRMLLLWAETSSIPHEELEETTANWLNATRASAAPKTTGRRMVSVRAYAKWAGMPNLLENYSLPRPARSRAHPIFEGVDGVKLMCESTSNPVHAALFAMQGLLGLRVSEARSVCPNDIDEMRMTMTVRGKGDVTRVVPISMLAWKYIGPVYTQAQFAGEPLVPISDKAARNAITRMGEALGFERSIASHDLRATCGTALYERTKDIRLVQDLLGHANITTTQGYIGVQMDAIRGGLEF